MAANFEANQLSEREREILRLVATGASNKEIAARLVISPNTVKVHLRNIFAKVGVASRTEATLYAIQRGLVDSPSAAVDPLMPSDLPAALPTPRPAWLRYALLFGLLGALALTVLSAWVLLERRPVAAPSAPALVRWHARDDLPQGRTGMAAAVYGNGLYLFGGSHGAGESDETLRCSPADGSCQALAPRPRAALLAQAAVLGERIYIPGGQSAGRALDALDIYDPRLDQWSAGARLPEPLFGYALAALDGRLYLFGGMDAGGGYSDRVYAYDPDLDAWAQGARLPASAAFSAAAPLGAGRILLAGGLGEAGALDRAAIYYPQRHLNGEPAWEEAPALPAPRYGMSMAPLANYIYLAGGASGPGSVDTLPPLQFNPQSGAWQPFEPSPLPVGLYPALLPYETHLHVLGGLLNGIPQSTHQSYQAIYTILIPAIQ